MRNIVGTGRTMFVAKLECLYLRYLRIDKANQYRRSTYVVTEDERFFISNECDDLIYNLVEGKRYLFQIANTPGGTRVVVDVLENQLDKDEN